MKNEEFGCVDVSAKFELNDKNKEFMNGRTKDSSFFI